MKAGWQVFISYARKDMAKARKVNAALRQAGIVAYQDVKSIPGGTSWRNEIVSAIEHSKVVLLLLSAHSVGSDQVPKELAVALKSGKAILPVALEPVGLSGDLSYELARLNVLPLYGSGWREKFDQVLSSLAIHGVRPSTTRGHLDPRAEAAPAEDTLSSRPVKQAVTARISTTRIHHGADHLIGREEELAALDKAWDNGSTHVLVIVAWGGVGKTSIVVEWMARKAAAGWPGFDRVFDWSFYSQGTREQGTTFADLFITAALEFFGGNEGTELAKSQVAREDKGAKLAEFIRQQRTLLVLDGLEPLQYPPGPLAGQIRDSALTALLKGLAQHNPGLCVVTTRERVADLAPFQDTTAPILELQHLSTPAGIELLSGNATR